MTFKRGFVLGKFMPPHAGHVSLCRAAEGMVEELTILVCSLPDDPISGEQRLGWMRELFPYARVEWINRVVPQAPEDSPDFWPIWSDIVREYHPEPIDLVFAGEAYGERLAAEVGGTFVPFLREESGLFADISATKVRGNQAAHWHHLPTRVRREWVKTVALHGVESVGKHTLKASRGELAIKAQSTSKDARCLVGVLVTRESRRLGCRFVHVNVTSWSMTRTHTCHAEVGCYAVELKVKTKTGINATVQGVFLKLRVAKREHARNRVLQVVRFRLVEYETQTTVVHVNPYHHRQQHHAEERNGQCILSHGVCTDDQCV